MYKFYFLKTKVWKSLLEFLMPFMLLSQHVSTQTTIESQVPIEISPPKLNNLVYGEERNVFVNYSIPADLNVSVILMPFSKDNGIAKVKRVNAPENGEEPYTITVYGEFLGRTQLSFVYNETELSDEMNFDIQKPTGDKIENAPIAVTYDVVVIRIETWLDTFFVVAVVLLVMISNITLGTTVDLEVVKEVLHRPVGPLIGLGCQFCIMPILGYCIILLFRIEGGPALGLFGVACSPGGGASNMYSYLLKGDVSLSVTMTLLSTAASFGMIPFWIHTLGTKIIEKETNVVIPFSNIFLSLAGVLVPVAIGIYIQKKHAKVAEILDKILRPLFIFIIIFLFTFGIWVNIYVVRLFNLRIVAASSLLPYLGYCIAAIVAAILQQPRERIITISIETGIQNTGIAIFIMKFSLPQPEADLSVISPVIISFVEPFPLFIGIAFLDLINRKMGKKDPVIAIEGEVKDGDNAGTKEPKSEELKAHLNEALNTTESTSEDYKTLQSSLEKSTDDSSAVQAEELEKPKSGIFSRPASLIGGNKIHDDTIESRT